jgi:hypothetical protein
MIMLCLVAGEVLEKGRKLEFEILGILIVGA